jgi:glutathione S-transferase
MLELYHHGTAVCAAKIRVMLAEKGLEWSGHYVDILNGEQFDPAYLKLNPKAVVPTLVHDGVVIRESTVIAEYLDEVFPEPPLKPSSPVERATMRIWSKRVDEELLPATAIITFAISHRHVVLAGGPEVVDKYITHGSASDRAMREERLNLGVGDPAVARALDVYERFFADMQAQLEHTPWLAGESYSIADVVVTPFVNRIGMLQLLPLWTDRFADLAGWWQRIMNRPSFDSAIMQFVPPPLAQLMREKGQEELTKVRELVVS